MIESKQKGLSPEAVVEFSDIGREPAQEDFYRFSNKRNIFVLSDGFGGPRSGAEAAKLSCDAVMEFLEVEAGDRDATMPFVLKEYYSLAGNILFNAILHANEALNRSNEGRNIHERGGASIVSAYLAHGTLAIANVGACEAYLFREGLQPLVLPKSLNRMRGGQSPLNAPLMALGLGHFVEPEIQEYEVRLGDAIVLASDGAVSEVLNRLPAALPIRAGESSEERAYRCEKMLREGQYQDNASVIIALF